MANPMSEMLMMEMSPADDGGMKAAKELDVVEDENVRSAAPVVTIKARTVKSLLDATNKVLGMFGAEPLQIVAVELEGEELPVPVIKALSMINAAMNDYMGEDAVDMAAMETDKGALIEIAKLQKVLSDKGFKKFLTSAPKGETVATEMTEDIGEEVDEVDEDAMMMRM